MAHRVGRKYLAVAKRCAPRRPVGGTHDGRGSGVVGLRVTQWSGEAPEGSHLASFWAKRAMRLRWLAINMATRLPPPPPPPQYQSPPPALRAAAGKRAGEAKQQLNRTVRFCSHRHFRPSLEAGPFSRKRVPTRAWNCTPLRSRALAALERLAGFARDTHRVGI
jgi:hypothetical protein